MRTTATILAFIATIGAASAAPRGNELDGSRFQSGEPLATGSIQPQFYRQQGDTDGDNDKNPSLPGYERNRGGETGGYERNLIPD